MLTHWVDVIALSKVKCQVPIQGDLKYASSENFLGRPVAGYHPSARDVCLMTKKAGLALCEAQNYFHQAFKLGLIIYDAFRPIRAVKDFVLWMNQPPSGSYELERKRIHYPYHAKAKLADLGYLPSTVSRHSFGHAVDVGLRTLPENQELPMGAIFDYFGVLSHTDRTALEIGDTAFSNREILIKTMSRFGFTVYSEEFWHFDYVERELEVPMDFPITPTLRGMGLSSFVF